MELALHQELLSATIDAVGKALPTRAINPILGFIRIEVAGDRAIFMGTDGDTTIMRSVACPLAVEGVALVPARTFGDLVKRLPKKDVSVKSEANRVHVKVGRSEYEMNSLDAEYYPEAPVLGDNILCKIECRELKRSIKAAAYAAVKQMSGNLHWTQGVLLAIENGVVHVVGSDGHRLGWRKIIGPTNVEHERRFLPPTKNMTDLEALLPDDDSVCKVYGVRNRVAFEFGNLVVACPVLDVAYAEYQRVVPLSDGITATVRVNREELADAMNRVVVLCTKLSGENPIASMKVEGSTLTLAGAEGESGKGKEELDIDLQGEGLTMTINPNYVTEMLKAMAGDEVMLKLTAPDKPLLCLSVRDPEALSLIMPVRS